MSQLRPFMNLFGIVWNSLDAKANTVEVKINYNDLDGLDTIYVIDDGEGIDAENIENNFGKFNESPKKYDDDKHGSHGRGRLAFHVLCNDATWYTSRKDYQARIEVKSDSIKDYERIEYNHNHKELKNFKSGTCVELINFVRSSLPNLDKLLEQFSIDFGWYLALNPKRKIVINKRKVTPPPHKIYEKNFTIEEHRFNVKVIQWHSKPSSEKSHNYLLSSDGKMIKKEFSKFNNKPNFHTSASVMSAWVDQYNPEALELDSEYNENTKIYKSILKELESFQRQIYKDFLIQFVDREIEKYDESGYFPKYKGLGTDYAMWRKNNTKSVLKSIYIADPTIFNKLKEKQTKIFVGLLDALLVSNENDALFEVLEGVLDLSTESITSLANQINKSSLENIISTIEILQKREQSVHQLEEIIKKRYKEVLEVPDLQKIIENNTWLFGSQYTTLGAEEDTFTKIAKDLRNEIKGIDQIEIGDLFEDVTIEGANRQPDLFLARKVPTHDASGNQIFKCIIIEIKRPSISLNRKHLQQLDDYAAIIGKLPEFKCNQLTFELILIGRDISRDDVAIKSRLMSLKDKVEFGLVTDNESIKCYIKSWFSLINEFRLRNDYLLGNLNTKLDDLKGAPTSSMVKDLQDVLARSN